MYGLYDVNNWSNTSHKVIANIKAFIHDSMSRSGSNHWKVDVMLSYTLDEHHLLQKNRTCCRVAITSN